MPVSLDWLNANQTILLYTFEGKWTWDEFREVDKPTWNLIASADHRIDIILDFTDITQFPLGLRDVIQMAGDGITPTEEGVIIVVSTSLTIKILLGGFRRIYPKMANTYCLVNTFDEAICMLEQVQKQSVSTPK